MEQWLVTIENEVGTHIGALIGQQWFISVVSSVETFNIGEEEYSVSSIIKTVPLTNGLYAYKINFKAENFVLIDEYIKLGDELIAFSVNADKVEKRNFSKSVDASDEGKITELNKSLVFNNSTKCLYGYFFGGLKAVDIEKILCILPELYDEQVDSQSGPNARRNVLKTKFYRNKNFDTNLIVHKNIYAYLSRQLRRKGALSTQLNSQTLIDAKILMNSDVAVMSNKHDLNNLIVTEVKKSVTNKYVLMAGGGQGKTAASLSIYNDLVSMYFNEETDYLPIYIDLPNTVGIEKIDCDEAFADFLCTIYLADDTELESFRVAILNKIRERKVYLIADAMDEYLGGRSLIEAREISENKLFLDFANLITIRSYDFKRYLTNTKFSSIVTSLSLLEWDADKYNEYIRRYLTYKGNPEKIEAIKKIVKDSDAFKLMATNPLRLNMIIEVCLAKASKDVIKLERLYATYFKQLINREIIRLNSVEIEDVEIFNCLKELAWLFYTKNDGSNSAGMIFENEFDALIQKAFSDDKQKKIKQIVMGTQIICAEEFTSLGGKVIHFSHNSYYEYFISSFIVGCMMSKKVECLKLFFCHYITSVVSQFIRETMASSQFGALAPDYRTEMVKPLLTVFIENKCEKTDVDFSRKRLARGQVAYYIGNLRTEIGKNFLMQEYENEKDPWVLRDIVFGLAFGNSSEYSDKYIALLLEERKCGGSEKNDINIGYYLSFFGDQQFDPLDPGKDQGFPGVSNTLSRILYFLASPEDKQAWRIHLYTLVDLFKYRKASKDEVVSFLKIHKETVLERLGALQSEMGDWDVFIEFQKILSEIEDD